MIVMMQGSTREDRHSVTSSASNAVGDAGGCVLDFKQFSNLAICLTIELPPAGFIKLREKLADLKVTMDQPTKEEISLAEVREDLEIPCSLRITFIHGEPDLRIQIPAVPG
jgi:hypothetical protein